MKIRLTFHNFSVILHQILREKEKKSMAITVKEQLEKHGSSVYPTGRTNKNGQDVYGIAFSYDDRNGKKKSYH